MQQPGRASRALFLVGLSVVSVIYLAHSLLFRRYVNDDAFITFRYSHALSAGLGPYFNPGEHVEGYTNFLWMLLMTPVIALGGEEAPFPTAKAIGIVAGLVALLLASAIVRSVLRTKDAEDDGIAQTAVVLAPALVAVSPYYAVQGPNGLETMLYGALLAAGIFLALSAEDRDRWQGAGVAFGLAALSRPEGAVVFAIYWCACAVSVAVRTARGSSPSGLLADAEFRRLVLDGAIVTAAVGAHFLFRFVAYDGELVPNTYWAKTGGFSRVAPLSYVREGVGTPFFGAVPALAGVLGFALDRTAPRRGLPLLFAAMGAAFSPLATGTDWMPGFRLEAPYLPLLAAVVAIGWCHLARLAFWRLEGLVPAALLALVPIAYFAQRDVREQLHDTIEVRARGYEHGHYALAEWLRGGAARPGDTIALMDIGIVGFLCADQRILDVTGLTDRTIARSPGPFLEKQIDPAYVLDQRPEFVVLVLASGSALDAPPPAASLFPWTPIERAIVAHPDFQRDYLIPRSTALDGAPWQEALAREIGAERIFVHDYPRLHYLLAVFASPARRGHPVPVAVPAFDRPVPVSSRTR